MNNTNKAIFLDRDWTLNFDYCYVHKIEDLQLMPWVDEWLKILKSLWYLLIIITNQSWIARKYYTEESMHRFNDELENRIWIKFDAIYFCPHLDSDRCDCRKPSIWNVLEAKKTFNIDLSQSFFIWDKSSDIECWNNAWIKTVLIADKSLNLDLDIKPDYTVESILEFSKILNNDL